MNLECRAVLKLIQDGRLSDEHLDMGDSMRPLKTHLAAYEGLSPNDVATGRVKTANSSRVFDPITIVADVDDQGVATIVLRDGRHRVLAARQAGATQIRARIIIHNRRKSGEWDDVYDRVQIIRLPRGSK